MLGGALDRRVDRPLEVLEGLRARKEATVDEERRRPRHVELLRLLHVLVDPLLDRGVRDVASGYAGEVDYANDGTSIKFEWDGFSTDGCTPFMQFWTGVYSEPLLGGEASLTYSRYDGPGSATGSELQMTLLGFKWLA